MFQVRRRNAAGDGERGAERGGGWKGRHHQRSIRDERHQGDDFQTELPFAPLGLPNGFSFDSGIYLFCSKDVSKAVPVAR